MSYAGSESQIRRIARRWQGLFVALLAVAVLAGISLTPASVSARFTLLTDALIMGGTTQSTPGQGFIDAVIRDFINPARPDTYTGTALTTPEQIVGINKSVSDGADIALAAIDKHQADHPGEPFVVFGYSQSTQIIQEVKDRLAARAAAGQPTPNVTFVGIGGGDWGSSITSRLNGIVVPVIDFRFRDAQPDVQPVNSIQIARQYDVFADTVQFPANPVALANSLLGIFVHLDYANAVSLDPTSANYVPGTQKVVDGKTTYYWIPTPDIPLFAPLRLAGVPEPVIDVVEPFFKVLAEAGYDREVPFNQPKPFQLIPTMDPLTLTLQLAAATLEGANNAAKLIGLQIPGFAEFAQQLNTAAATTYAAAAPYRAAVRSVNDALNIEPAIAEVEAPIATEINKVTNGLGIPDVANQVIDSTVFPLSAQTFDNVFAPVQGAGQDPLSQLLRQFLDRLTPDHSAATSNAVTTVAAADNPSGDEVDANVTASPKPHTLRADAANTTTTEKKRGDRKHVSRPSDKKPSDTKTGDEKKPADKKPSEKKQRQSTERTPKNAGGADSEGNSPASTSHETRQAKKAAQ